MLVEVATLGLVTILLALARSHANWRARAKGCPTPPSRPGWPILGNLLDLAAVLGAEWEAYMEWGKELGTLLDSWREITFKLIRQCGRRQRYHLY
jgi:hypothetical protein